MATNFSPLSASCVGAACVTDAITNLITGLAQMSVLTASTDANVVSFASDLAANAANLRAACTQDIDGSQKSPGTYARPMYLAGAGL
jgi:hypothetical protein